MEFFRLLGNGGHLDIHEVLEAQFGQKGKSLRPLFSIRCLARSMAECGKKQTNQADSRLFQHSVRDIISARNPSAENSI